eukprot:94922-Pleurochrysis_carterae.AAC.1
MHSASAAMHPFTCVITLVVPLPLVLLYMACVWFSFAVLRAKVHRYRPSAFYSSLLTGFVFISWTCPLA